MTNRIYPDYIAATIIKWVLNNELLLAASQETLEK
jgi:hypothetical protein